MLLMLNMYFTNKCVLIKQKKWHHNYTRINTSFKFMGITIFVQHNMLL